MTTTGEHDVVDLLLEQHNQIKTLFAEVAAAQGERRLELFHDLVRLLAVHESAEEQVVHPAARSKAGDAVVEARLHEEDEAKHALSDLYDLGVDHPEFDTGLATLAQAVLDHATHEEQEEFTRLRQETSPEQLRRMSGAVRAAEAVSPTRPHPGAGESALANMLVGPPVAVFDKVRDAVRDWRQSNRD
ncbi:hemerythrin domain-containing protein [Microbispora sp. ATCC PTA-5024]|uniref:hemerythrin domain-containing protein n=1 Tax=Microbispora sp. ATCC PTA-5024 TaxID=316330 RepID=UPI0003DC4769|nr:hemerythrin domain-containing protein [Microbispora sp. ATCC PTA-5024]ETK30667.1 hemerythrin [Microbispora sp. ATCC PTA-5024]